MDLTHISGALRRFWWLALLGVVAAAGLGYYAYSATGTKYASDSTLFVTQSGFPWGRTVLATEGQAVTPQRTSTGPAFADSARFTELAALYSRLAGSDAVRNRVLKGGPIDGEVTPGLVFTSDSSSASALPLLRIRAIADTPEDAVALATRWSDAFRAYIAIEQKRGRVPARQRVLLQPVETPAVRTAQVVEPKTMTRPIAIALAVLILVFALIVQLDRMRRRRRGVERDSVQPPSPDVESPGDALATGQARPRDAAG